MENKTAMPTPTSPTYGEKAVGLTFNPSNDPIVHKIKELYAEIIDFLACEIVLENNEDSEKVSLLNEAIRQAQTACMWAAKAVTWRD